MLDAREETLVVNRERTDAPVVRRSQRTLTVEDLALRRAEERESGLLAERTEASAETVSARPPSEDPSVALRQARIGVFAALTLVLFLVWIRQRRKGRS